MKEKKIGFFSVTCLAIGTIVGAGVFGTIPAAAGIVGTGIEWAYFIAFISILICYIPQMVTISVLPAPFTFYMHTTRLVHPTAGYMLVIFGFNYVFILSALAGVFAEYASVYIPVDHRILGVGALLFFRLYYKPGSSGQCHCPEYHGSISVFCSVPLCLCGDA